MLLEQEGHKNVNEIKFEKSKDFCHFFEITLRLKRWNSMVVIVSQCCPDSSHLRTPATALLCVSMPQALVGTVFSMTEKRLSSSSKKKAN